MIHHGHVNYNRYVALVTTFMERMNILLEWVNERTTFVTKKVGKRKKRVNYTFTNIISLLVGKCVHHGKLSMELTDPTRGMTLLCLRPWNSLYSSLD